MDIVAKGKIWPSISNLFSIALTFGMTTLAWVFFRAKTIEEAFAYISDIFTLALFDFPTIHPAYLFILLIIFMAIEWMGREGKYALENLGLSWKKPVRLAMYYALVLMILWYSGKEQQFIYFQF